MKIKISIIFIIAFSIVALGQELKVENGNLSIKFLKAKKVSNTLNLNSTSRIKSKELKKVLIKCKLKSLDKNAKDLNKFSLVDHKNKLRYRPTDISTQTVGQINITKLLKTDVKLGGMYKLQAGILYEPEIEDTFTNYDINGYTNVEIPYTFNKRKNKKGIVYFQPVRYNFKAHFFFAILTKSENSELELYYGSEKIYKIEL